MTDFTETGILAAIVGIMVALVEVIKSLIFRIRQNGNPGHFTPGDRILLDKLANAQNSFTSHDREMLNRLGYIIERMEKQSGETNAAFKLFVQRFDTHLQDFQCLRIKGDKTL